MLILYASIVCKSTQIVIENYKNVIEIEIYVIEILFLWNFVVCPEIKLCYYRLGNSKAS